MRFKVWCFERQFKRMKQTDYRMMEEENERGNDEVDISKTPPKKKGRQHSPKYLAEYESLFLCFRKSSVGSSNAYCTVCG
jgi:hypothetical protein